MAKYLKLDIMYADTNTLNKLLHHMYKSRIWYVFSGDNWIHYNDLRTYVIAQAPDKLN